MSLVAEPRHRRIAGIDVARAVALLGMFAAHIGNESAPGGWPWLVVAHGRSSALFALLAGVSISLMLAHARTHSRRSRAGGDNPVRHTRIRVAARGGMLIMLGWVLAWLKTPVDIILDNLGVMFVLVLVTFRWRARTLLAVGAAVLALGRPALTPITDRMPEWLYNLPVAHELWSQHYPALIWVGYVLVGMGVGRLAPWRGSALTWLAASGLALAVLAYGGGLWLRAARGERDWYAVGPHSYTGFEMLGNVGVALLTIAACSWLAGALPRVTWPVAAAGSMTLTLYSAQVLVIAFAGHGIVTHPSNAAWLALCVAAVAFATVWRWRVGQGPLEAIVTDASTAIADARRRVRATTSS